MPASVLGEATTVQRVERTGAVERAPDLIHTFIRGHAAEAARVLENHPLHELTGFFVHMPPDLSAALFETMEASTAAACLERMEAGRAAEAVTRLPLERGAPLLRRLHPEGRRAVLELLPPDRRRHFDLLLSCREDTAGALMDPRVLTLPPEVTAAEALDRVRANPEQASHYLYVVDRDHTLAGVLSLRELTAGGKEATVSTLMRRDVICLRMDHSLASVRVHSAWLDFQILPVLDNDGRFAGALRHKTLRRLAGVQDPGRYDQAGTALGELYRVGLSALVKGALEIGRPPAAERPETGDGPRRGENPR